MPQGERPSFMAKKNKIIVIPYDERVLAKLRAGGRKKRFDDRTTWESRFETLMRKREKNVRLGKADAFGKVDLHHGGRGAVRRRK